MLTRTQSEGTYSLTSLWSLLKPREVSGLAPLHACKHSFMLSVERPHDAGTDSVDLLLVTACFEVLQLSFASLHGKISLINCLHLWC